MFKILLGIFLGVVVAYVFIALLKRMKQNRPGKMRLLIFSFIIAVLIVIKLVI